MNITRWLVRRKADSLYLATHHRWTDDASKARTFSRTGHARNSLASYVPYRKDDGTYYTRDEVSSIHREQFDSKYELVPITYTLEAA